MEILKIKKRPYQCKECGHEVEIETNHEIECYPFCKGACHQIINGRRISKQTTHIFTG